MKIVYLICLLGISVSAFGEVSDPKILEKNLIAANSQIEILKSQLELIKGYQDKFLSTVYWSLGGVVTLAILLIGTNWFINYRSNEKEAELLRENIKNQLDSISNQLEKRFNTLKEVLLLENKKSLEEMASVIQEDIFSKIQIDEQIKKRELSIIKKDVVKLECDYWVRREVYANALRTQIELLKSPVVMRSEFTINDALEKIEEIFKLINLENKKTCLTSRIVTELTSVFKDYEDNHHMTINKLKGILSDLIAKG